MPLLLPKDQFQEDIPQGIPQPEARPRPETLDLLASSFRQNNIVSSLYDRFTSPTPQFTPNPDYNVLDDLKGYEEKWRSFLESESPEETAYIKQWIDRERHDQQVIQDGGGWGFVTSAAAGFTDIATLASMALPVAKGVTLPGVISKMVATQAAVDTASELAFHSLQDTRTIEQSFLNIGASAIATGLLGSIAAKVPKKDFDALEKAISDEIVNNPLEVGARSMGAAQRGADTTLAQESIAGVGQRIARTIGKITPLARLMTSPSKVARQVTQDIAETPFMLTKNEQLIANKPAIETILKRYDAPIARISTTLDESFKKYKERLGNTQTPIKLRQFKEEVAGALRRGDESKIPEVQALAKQIRSEVLDPIKKDLMETGLLVDPVKADQAKLKDKAIQKYVDAQTAQIFTDYVARTKALFQPEEFRKLLRDELKRRSHGASGAAVSSAPEPIQKLADVIGETSKVRNLAEATLESKISTIENARQIGIEKAEAAADVARAKYSDTVRSLEGMKRAERAVAILKARNVRDAALRAAKEIQRKERATAADAIRKARAEASSEIRKAREAVTAARGKAFDKFQSAKVLSKEDFIKRAEKAGDADDLVSEVNDLAALLRKQRLGELDDIPSIPKTRVTDSALNKFADSYFPRLYNVLKIKNNRTAWEDTLRGWFRTEGIDALEAEALTQDVTRTILGTMRGFTDIQTSLIVKAGPLKERTLAIPDHVLEPFLINDIEKVLTQHIRTVAPQLELKRRFGELDMKQAIQNITDDYDILLKAAKTDAEKNALTASLKSDITDLKEQLDRLTGKAGIPADPDSMVVRGARLMRNYSYVRLLGGQVLQSISDAGRIITQFGMAKTAKSMAKFATNLKAWKGTREEAKRLGIGLDWTLNTRGATLGDIGEYAETTAEEYAQKAANMFTRVTGMATWNSSMKFLVSALQQDEILKIAIKGGASQRSLAKLAQIGIGPSDLKKIAAQFEKHGDASEGLRRARSDLWDDKELALRYEAAILKSADTLVMTKGVGDTPNFMSGEVWKTVFQFKSFGMAAVNRLIIPVAQGVQRGDIAVINGLMVMLTLGYMRYAAKQWFAEQPIETTPDVVIKEAIDGAGLTTYLAEPYDVFAGIAGLPRFSRYKDRAWQETLLGPNAGTLTDMMSTVEDLRRDGVSQRDIHKFRKLLPGQNIFYLRRAINALENEAGEALGVPEEGR